MVGVQDAAIRSSALVDVGLTPSAWALMMVNFNEALGGRDPVIRRAAHLGPVLTDSDDAQVPFSIDSNGELSAGEHRLVRLASIQATRASSRRIRMLSPPPSKHDESGELVVSEETASFRSSDGPRRPREAVRGHD